MASSHRSVRRFVGRFVRRFVRRFVGRFVRRFVGRFVRRFVRRGKGSGGGASPSPRSVARALLAVALIASSGLGAEESRNRLAAEMSPYLQLHAHNPVDWYPWGDEALERAKKEDKPIFLSVGYSTCYWCHVMEREVFSDPEIAELMNRWFVNVKVDREERPDLDEIYMAATQLLTGRGGWPNSVFLTPELEPFFAGTYFPPEDRPGMTGFPRVLEGLQGAWENRREEVLYQAGRVTAALRQALTGAPEGSGPPAGERVEAVVEALGKSYDPQWGGFGQRQKFPSPANLRLLWDRALQGDAESRRRVVATLGHMGRGALYDQIDGGFHRYTLDRQWRVPHFEKMLYDNAQLGELLALVSAEIGDPELERLARGTLDFVLGRMTLANGAFKSAIDAETDAVEGAYYIWTRDELESTLGREGFALVAPIFGLDGAPNFEADHHTLFLTAPLAEHAERLGIGREELLARLDPEIAKLRAVRSRREFPLVDDKVLTDWNGMMVAALARAGVALAEERYLVAAERAAGFLLGLVDEEGTLLHVWRDGEARIPAFLDDYVFLIDALLALDEAGREGNWLASAQRLAEQMADRLAAPGGGYYASAERPHLLVRSRPAGDGAIPAANGVAVINQLRLARRTGLEEYRRKAARALGGFSRDLEQNPAASVTLARALALFHRGPPPSVRAAADGVPATGEQLARSVVRASARFRGGQSGGSRPFRLELEIAGGWHLNANPASFDFLIPTTVGGSTSTAVYPPGSLFRAAFAPEAIAVYSGRVRIEGEALPSAEAIELTYQACDEERCLPPLTIEVPLTAPGS